MGFSHFDIPKMDLFIRPAFALGGGTVPQIPVGTASNKPPTMSKVFGKANQNITIKPLVPSGFVTGSAGSTAITIASTSPDEIDFSKPFYRSDKIESHRENSSESQRTKVPSAGKSLPSLVSSVADAIAVGNAFKANNYAIRISSEGVLCEIASNPVEGLFFGDLINTPSTSNDTFSCTYSSGVVEQLSFHKSSKNRMTVRITDVHRKKSLTEFEFVRSSDGANWEIEIQSGKASIALPQGTVHFAIPVTNSRITIPVDTKPSDIMLNLWIANFTLRNSIVKVANRLRDEPSAAPIPSFELGGGAFAIPDLRGSPNPGPDCPASSSETPPGRGGCSSTECCIPHDLVCTLPAVPFWLPGLGTGGIESGTGGHLAWFRDSCGNTITIDITNCCFHHDIDMWCSENDWQLSGANATAALCVATSLGIAIANESSKNVFDELCIVAMQIIAPLYWPLTFSEVFLSLESILFWPDSRDLVGYRGMNSASCLCGGNLPTYQCGGVEQKPNAPASRCNDLCVGAGLTANEKCFPCSWQCQRDSAGNHIGTYLQTDQSGQRLPCCPGSACTTDFDGTPCKSFADADAKCNCSECGYCCGCVHKHIGPITPHPSTGKGGGPITLGLDCDFYWLPRGDRSNCCEGTGGSRPNSPCDINTSQFLCPS